MPAWGPISQAEVRNDRNRVSMEKVMPSTHGCELWGLNVRYSDIANFGGMSERSIKDDQSFDLRSPATERAFFHRTKVHAALGIILFSDHKLADHPSIARNPDGFLCYATAWLEYRLRGNRTAADAFIGAHPELLSNASWSNSAIK